MILEQIFDFSVAVTYLGLIGCVLTIAFAGICFLIPILNDGNTLRSVSDEERIKFNNYGIGFLGLSILFLVSVGLEYLLD